MHAVMVAAAAGGAGAGAATGAATSGIPGGIEVHQHRIRDADHVIKRGECLLAGLGHGGRLLLDGQPRHTEPDAPRTTSQCLGFSALQRDLSRRGLSAGTCLHTLHASECEAWSMCRHCRQDPGPCWPWLFGSGTGLGLPGSQRVDGKAREVKLNPAERTGRRVRPGREGGSEGGRVGGRKGGREGRTEWG